jgi:hypothetical protein
MLRLAEKTMPRTYRAGQLARTKAPGKELRFLSSPIRGCRRASLAYLSSGSAHSGAAPTPTRPHERRMHGA